MDQRHCSCCDQMLPKESFKNETGDCEKCHMKRLFIELFESPEPEHHLWKFREWSADVYDTRSLLEEEDEFLQIEVLKKNLSIDISVRKRPDSDDEFQVWVGDKQLIVKASGAKKGLYPDDLGKVISIHKSNEIIDDK